MGSGTSKIGSKQSQPRVHRSFNRSSSTLSSFLCGASSSRAALEMEDGPDEILITSARHCDPVFRDVRNHCEESLFSGTGTGSTSSSAEIGSPSESSVAATDGSVIDGFKHLDAKCSSESKELVAPYRVSSAYDHGDSDRHRSSNEASSSFKEQRSSDHVSASDLANKDDVNVLDNSARRGVSHFRSETTQPRDSFPYGLENSGSRVMHVENFVGGVSTAHAGFSSAPNRSDVPYSLGNESIQEAVPPSQGFPLFDTEPGREDGDVLQVDVVSISSSIFNDESSNWEARRNSRRLFWDAFSRRSSRRHMDSSAFLLSTDDVDDMGSHNRWLLDFNGDVFDDGIDSDSGYLGSRIQRFNEQRRQSRSEIWERLRSGLRENGRRNTPCPSGYHTEGTCSCESLLTSEDSSTRAISRIVMLAEALFEVLDEIHRQPVSLALSMVSLPAPESVVDSFPLKDHKKMNKVEGCDDIEQCYICLSEYEEGDRIRVLPCNHEYHMSCVDKWLKEIHGVCPLCRGDVRQGTGESSVPNSEMASV